LDDVLLNHMFIEHAQKPSPFYDEDDADNWLKPQLRWVTAGAHA